MSALSSDGSADSNSSMVTVTTYRYPAPLSLQQANVSSLTVGWPRPQDGTVHT